MLNLPSESPFTPAVQMLIILACVKACAMICLVAAMAWMVREFLAMKGRESRLLSLAEDYAQLGKERRDDAKNVVATHLDKKSEEIKDAVKQIEQTVPTLTVQKLEEKQSNSGVGLPTVRTDPD